MAVTTDSLDMQLARFYRCQSDVEARSLLDALTREDLRTFIRPIIARRLERVSIDGRSSSDDISDCVQLTLISLARRLAESRADGAQITNLKAYASTCAEHVCDEHFRKAFPVRYRVSKRVESQLVQRETFRPWRDNSNSVYASLSGWFEPPPIARDTHTQKIQLDARTAAAEALRFFPPQTDQPNKASPETSQCMFSGLMWTEGALAFELMVKLVQGARNEFDLVRIHEIDEIPVTEPQIGDLNGILVGFWAAMRLLRPNQGKVLLLNLEFDGHSMVKLLMLLGVATLGEIAQTMGMPESELAATVADIPLSNSGIGEMIGRTAQQVAELRSAARAQITAHMVASMGISQRNFLGGSDSKQGE
jgi:DNA-directed RNA polymerase specialized sigma24 family protein